MRVNDILALPRLAEATLKLLKCHYQERIEHVGLILILGCFPAALENLNAI